MDNTARAARALAALDAYVAATVRHPGAPLSTVYADETLTDFLSDLHHLTATLLESGALRVHPDDHGTESHVAATLDRIVDRARMHFEAESDTDDTDD